MVNRKFIIIFFFHLFALFFQTSFLYAQTQNASAKDLFTTWRVAVVGIQADDFTKLSPHLQKSSLSLEPLLNVMIKNVPTRDLSTLERFNAREALRNRALLGIQKELDKKILAADVLALADDKYETWLNRIKSNQEIKKIKRRMKKIETLKNESIPVNNILKIAHVEQSEYISISPVADLEKISNELNVYQLFYFTLKELDEKYVIMNIYSYNNIIKTITPVIQTTVDTDKIDQIQTSLSNAITQSVLGTPFASLNIKVQTTSDDPIVKRRIRDAPILVDGDLVGLGQANISVIRTGVHSIVVLSEDQQRSLTVSLSPNERATRIILFNIDEQKTITLTTNPPNAKAYINSEWIGNTPLVLPKPSADAVTQVSIQLSGYYEALIPLTYTSESAINIALAPTSELPLEDRLKRDRNRFYTAFAIFGVSLVVPIVLNGIYTSENVALRAISNDTGPTRLTQKSVDEALMRRDALFYSYIGTSILSGGLSIYAFVELTRYLKTASEYHKR